jgi:site-specific DNA-methyltransferase (adenine-specific)
MLAFGGTRTFHRLTCAIEDAGWEIRDCLMWVQGQGFPKSLDVSKAIDKTLGAQREIVGTHALPGYAKSNVEQGAQARNTTEFAKTSDVAASEEAAQWQGWGTSLKPAWEPIILARRPLAGTVAANVLEHGTGALNIDASRVGGAPRMPGITTPGDTRTGGENNPPSGRWPANFMLSHLPECEQVGVQTESEQWKCAPGCPVPVLDAHAEGASRFFYCPKVNKAERGEGNNHPTVKPIALLEYLIKLISPPDGVILDPFAGSGSTLLAARNLGFPCIGIEREPAYYDITLSRIGGG